MPAYYASIICWHILLIRCWVATCADISLLSCQLETPIVSTFFLRLGEKILDFYPYLELWVWVHPKALAAWLPWCDSLLPPAPTEQSRNGGWADAGRQQLERRRQRCRCPQIRHCTGGTVQFKVRAQCATERAQCSDPLGAQCAFEPMHWKLMLWFVGYLSHISSEKHWNINIIMTSHIEKWNITSTPFWLQDEQLIVPFASMRCLVV